MGKKFNTYVAVHKDPAESVWFAPGDDVPDWALDLVGDHVYGDAEAVEDVRLTDPHYEDDDPDASFFTPNTLPATVGETVDDVDDDEIDLSTLKKDELIALAEERDLDTSGTKAELIERIADHDAE